MDDEKRDRDANPGPHSLRYRIEPPAVRKALDATDDSDLRDADNPAEGLRTLPLVLCLHGWGMDGDWFARLTQELFTLPAIFVFPTAPKEVRKDDGSVGWSWYDYDGSSVSFVAELARLESALLGFVHGFEATHGLRPVKRVLVGFSQGGYGGSYIALRNPDVFQALAISGARIKNEALLGNLEAAAALGMQVLACHGSRDPHVSRDRARASVEALARAGIDARWEEFDAGHSLGRAQIKSIRAWLRELLPAAE